MAQAVLDHALGGRELRPVVDAVDLLFRDDGDGRPVPEVAGDLDEVRQVILALGVVVLHPVEKGERQIAPDGHQAAVAERDRPFRFGGVLVLADGQKLVAGRDEAPIPRRILRLEAHRDDGGPLAQAARAAWRRFPEVTSGVSPYATITSSVRLLQSLPRAQNRMSRAKPVPLHEDASLRQGFLSFLRHVLVIGPDDDGGARGAGRFQGREHMSEHGAVGDLMQHFRLAGFHPGAFACRENDGEAAAR